jgi:salicylate hydroxylase
LLPAPTVHNSQQPITLPPLARSSLAPDRSPAAITAASPSLFLGGDGAISFTQLILNAMNPDAPSRVQSSTQFFSSPRDPSREMPDAKLHDLPPDVRELVQRYFDFHHVLTPIFHVPSIFPRIDQVLNMDRTRRFEDPLILAMINMICAISAAHRRNGFETSTVQTRKYYDRAMTLVGPSVLFDWSVEKVQIFLLGARYLQSSNFPDESWTLLGLAIRIAQGLELHRPPPDTLDCIQKEVRKRLWYACYMTDQLASTIYGRPVSTASSTFTTPLPEDLDDDRIQPSQLLYPPTPILSTMSHSIQGVKLCRIMESALTLVDPPLEKIVELDEQFEAWDAQLPSAFRIYEHESALDDKKLIMAMRANMTRILIHRHSVVKSLSLLSRGERLIPLPDGLRANMMQNSRHICVRSAEDTIQLVGRRHDTTKAVTGPSWFNLYYCKLFYFCHLYKSTNTFVKQYSMLFLSLLLTSSIPSFGMIKKH